MEIAQISIGTGLDLSGAMRDLQRFGAMAQPTVKIVAEADESNLTALNKHLNLKQKHIRQVVADYKANVIRPLTDDRNLTQLNKSLDVTQARLVNVVRLAKELKGVGSISIGVSASSSSGNQAVNERMADAIGKAVAKYAGRDDTSRGLGRVEKATQRVEQATRANKPGIVSGVMQGVFQSLGAQLGGGIQQSLKNNLGVDLRKTAKGGTDALAKPVAGLVTKNPELQKTLDQLGIKINQRMGKVGDVVIDSLIEAIDAKGGTITDRLNIFIKKAFADIDVSNLAKDVGLEVAQAGGKAAQSVAKAPYAREAIGRYGESLTARRERLLREKAIPLVRQRAAEILEQKRSKNSAKLVTEETKEALIMTGGYARRGGMSGAAMEKKLGREFGEEVVRIWIKNIDTDLSNEKGNPAEIPWSLAKPNLRGYSKDAVEMASQGLAALEKNPDIVIKFLGESGGGFVAEEAARILEMMGVGKDRMQSLGVGTPDFIGAPKSTTNKKLISPDEELGADVDRRLNPLGLAGRAEQDALGVSGHSLDYYAKAAIAELAVFLEKPEKMMQEQVDGLKDLAAQMEGLDTSDLSGSEIYQMSQLARQSLQLVRGQIISETEQVSEEMKELAELFKKIYIKTATAPKEHKAAKATIEKLAPVLAEAQKNPGLGVVGKIDPAIAELKEVQSKLNEKYGDAVGTYGMKAEILRDQLSEMIASFEDPSLSVRKRTPAVIPEVLKDEIDVDPIQGELLEPSKSFIDKVKEAIVIRAQNDIERVKDGIEGAIVGKLNDKLMRVPGNPNVVDPSRQIGGADELTGADYLKIVRVEIEDTLRTLLSAGSRGYAVAQGAENALMGAVPPLGLIKGVTQKVGLPMAAFSAAGHLPGVGAAEGLATGGVEALLGLPAEQLAGAMSGAFADAVNVTIANLPLIGGKLAPAMTEAVTQLLLNAGGTVAEVGANLITPVVGGQMMLGTGEQAIKSVLPAIPDQQIAANRQLQAATEQQIKILGKGIETAKALMSVNPEKSQRYIEGVQRDYPQIGGQINEAIGALPPSGRMSDETGGGELARLKAAFAKAQKDLERAEAKATKLGGVIAGWAEIIQNPLEAMQKQVQGMDDVIDVEFEEVRPRLALPDAKTRLQEQFDAMVSASANQIKDLGEELSRQSKALKSSKLDPNVKAEVAAAIDANIAAARSAVDAVVGSFGGQVPKEIKEAAKSTRQRITGAGKSAQSTLKESKDAGIAIPDGLNVGVESRLDELAKTAEQMAGVVIEAVENKLEIRSPSRVFERMGEMVVKGFELGLQGFSGAMSFVDDVLAKIEDKFDLAQGSLKNFAGGLKTIAFGFVAFQAAQELIPMIIDLIGGISMAAMEFEKFERSMNFVSGSAAKTQATFAALRTEAKLMGGDFSAAIEGQAKISAATRGTSLEGAATDQITSASRQTASVLGFTEEEAKGTNKAFSDMLSKGKVQAEELRGQLGDRLPGAFNLFAESIGVTTSQLDKMMERGEVGRESLVRFAAQLKAETSTGVAGAANSAQGSLNRFNNEVYAMQVGFGKAVLPVQSLGLAALTKALEVLQVIFPVATAAAIGFAVKGLSSIAIGALSSGTGIATLSKGLFALPGALMKASIAFAPMAAQALVFVAIADAIGIMGKMFGETEGASKDFADSATKGMENYLRLTGEATDETKRLADSLKSLPKSYGEDTILGGLAKGVAGDRGTQFIREYESGQGLGGNVAKIESLINPLQGLLRSIPGMESRTNNEAGEIIKQNDAANAAAVITSKKMQEQLALYRQGGGDISKVRDVDVRMRDLQARRGLLGASDDAGRAAIDKEYQQLAKDREKLSTEINALNAQVRADIEARKAASKQIEDALSQSGLSPERQKELQAQLKLNTAEIEKGEASLKEYGKAINTAIVGAAKLESQLQGINDAASYRDTQAGIASAQMQTAIALQQSNGATPGQAQSMTSAAEQASTAQSLANLNQTMTQLNTLLQSPTTSRAFGMSGLSASSTSADIGNYIAEFSGDTESEEFKILQQAQKQKQQLEQLQLQSAQGQAQLAQSQAQTQESIKQTTREINDYVRGIGEQIEDIGRTIEQQDLDTQIQTTKNDLKRNLSGFSDRFFGDFIGGLESLIDLINEPMKRMNDAQGQISGMMRGLAESQRSGADMMRNAQSGASAGIPSAFNQQGRQVRVIRSGQQDEFGSELLQAQLIENGQLVRSMNVVSGVPSRQNFRTAADSPQGSMEPLGEGRYTLGRPELSASGFGEGLGNSWIDIIPQTATARGALGAHPDANRSYSPGTAGCIGFIEVRDATDFNEFVKDGNIQMTVDYGLGTVPGSGSLPESPSSRSQPTRLSGGGSNVDRYLNRLAYLESDFDANATGYTGVEGGGRAQGAFQFTPITVQDATAAGIGDPRQGTIVEQAKKAYAFIQRFHPEAAAAIESGNFTEADRQLRGRWTSLPGGGEQSAKLEQSNQYLRGEGLQFTTGGGAGGAGGMISVPGANTSAINPALSQLGGSIQAQTQSVMAQIAAQNEGSAIALRQGIEAGQQKLEQARREIIDEARQYDERYQDSILAAFGDSPMSSALQQLTVNSRETEEQTRSMGLTIQEATTSLDNLKAARERIVTDPNLAKLQPLIPGMDQSIATYEQQIDRIELARDREQRILSDRRETILNNLEATGREELRTLNQQVEDLRIQQQAGMVRDPQLSGMLEGRTQRLGVSREFETESTAITNEIAKISEGLERLKQEAATNGTIVDPEQVQIATNALENLNARLDALESKRNLNLQVIDSQQLELLRQYNKEQDAALLSANVEAANNRNDVFGANEIQRLAARNELMEQYRLKIESINQMQIQMQGQEGYTAESFDQMRSKAEGLNNVSLDNLKQQFPDLATAVNGVAFQAFSNLGGSVSALIKGTGTLEDVFDSFTNSIIDGLADMAVKWAASQLFGLFMGVAGGGDGGGGSAGLSIGGGNTLAAGNFDNGGLIPGRYTGTADQHVARVNPGEFIMQRSAVAAHGLGRMNAINMGRFDDGGFVGETPRYRDFAAKAGDRGSNQPVKVEYSVTEINSVRYVSEEQFQRGLQATSEATEKRMRNSSRNSPSYRSAMGY